VSVAVRVGGLGTMGRVKRRILISVVAGVVVLAALAGAGAAWWHWDTGRQPQVGDVVAAMNRAVADVVVAAGPGAAVAVSPVVRSTDCHLGFLRTGGIFSARADLYTNPGGEDALITAIGQRLPAGYAATRGPLIAGARSLQATSGAVSVAVQRLSPGWLGVIARSACSLGKAAAPAPAAATGPAESALTGLLAHLGTKPATSTEQQVACATGNIVTVSAVSEPVDSSRLATRLAAAVPATATRFASGDSNRVVYRDGTTSVIIAASDDGTSVTAQYTTAC
jgi:hypothetical protein